MLIPVIRKVSKEESRLHFLNIDEILYVFSGDHEIIFHTKDEVFYQMSTLQDYSLLWADMGFDRTDRCCVVNMNKVKSVDFELGLVLFEENEKGVSKNATVTMAKMQKLKKHWSG